MDKISIKDFAPRKGIDYVKDPIYKYIPFTSPYDDKKEEEVTEKDLIDSPWVQRLRRIKQCQGTYSVYPGADHSRFQHSLGVMHLAGQFAREWYSRFFKKMAGKLDVSSLPETFPSVEYVEEVFRIAGLFHDVGHGPFSHVLDEAYKVIDLSITHEDISTWIVEDILEDKIKDIQRSPSGNFGNKDEKIDPAVVAWLIKGGSGKDFEEDKFLWLRLLSPILSGLYSVDKLDYLVRDAMYVGSLEYGQIDVERFRLTSFIALEEGLCLEQSSNVALRNMILARLDMYQSCYYHKTVRAFECTAKKLLPKTLELLELQEALKKSKEEFLSKFFEFDEYTLCERAYRWKRSQNPEEKAIGEEWFKLYHREIPWKLAYESPEYITSEPVFARLLGEFLASKFKEEFWKEIEALKSNKERLRSAKKYTTEEINSFESLPCDDVWFDSPIIDNTPLNPLVDTSAISIYDSVSGKTREEGIRRLLSSVPGRLVIVRIYTKNKLLRRLIADVAAEVFSKISPPKNITHH